MNPLISVVIPTFNRKELVVEAIRSVLQQEPHNYEIIVVDDGSTDGTTDQIANFEHEIIVLTSENRGISHARNFGIKKSRGEFIAFLDSDDLWMPGIIDAQYQFLDSHPHIPLVYTDQLILSNGKQQVETRFQKDKPRSSFKLPGFVEFVPIHSSAVMVRKSIFDEVGMFDESLKIHEDTDMWNRISEKYELGFIEKPLSIFRWEQDPEHLLKSTSRQLFLDEGRKYIKIYEERRSGKANREEQQAIKESYRRINELQSLHDSLEKGEISEDEFQKRKEQLYK